MEKKGAIRLAATASSSWIKIFGGYAKNTVDTTPKYSSRKQIKGG
jgi:hypothetical protein